jgi:NAD dependent epimerase/dehydratase
VGAWSGRRVLVTGGEGFIGSHLVELLLEEGAEVRALVHYEPRGSRGWLEGRQEEVDIVAGDVRDAERVFTAMSGTEVVFHLAALIGIPYSYEATESYIQVNVTGTHNVLQAARRAGVHRVVHTSTSEVYGTALRVPIDEAHPLQPQSPYAATKVGADMLAMSFHRSFELPVAIARPFNTYGPRQSTRAVIPSLLSQLYDDGVDSIHVGSTSPTRDFNYVTDTAAGFLAIAGADRALGEVVNIGSGREISIGDLIELLFEVTGIRKPLTTDEQRLRPKDSEVHRLLADASRAREWTGWILRVPLEDGLRATADWVRENLPGLQARTYHV